MGGGFRISWDRRLGALLEKGCPELSPLGHLWAHWANPVRPCVLPTGTRIVGVGGATLGGGYKTPFVLALARALSPSPKGLGVVASGYPAREPPPRRAGDSATRDGDEAVLLEAGLRDREVSVWVGRPREAVLALAAQQAPILLVDGLLQARPQRLDCSILVLNGAAPFGSGRCPPAGDLRAPPPALFAASDLVVLVNSSPQQLPHEEGASGGWGWLREAVGADFPEQRPIYSAKSQILGAWDQTDDSPVPNPTHIPLSLLRNIRLGVALSVAHPERVLESLSEIGIEPIFRWMVGDHGHFPKQPPPTPRLDAWLTTAKCRTKLPNHLGNVPVWAIDHQLVLPGELICRVQAAVAG